MASLRRGGELSNTALCILLRTPWLWSIDDEFGERSPSITTIELWFGSPKIRWLGTGEAGGGQRHLTSPSPGAPASTPCTTAGAAARGTSISKLVTTMLGRGFF